MSSNIPESASEIYKLQGYVDEAAVVADVGVPGLRHDRYLVQAIDTTHPGDDTFSVTFTQADNVRGYQLFPIGTDGDLMKVAEDAMNGLQASTWLAEASSSSADSNWDAVLTNQWSREFPLSKKPSDLSLSRLDFEMFTGAANVTAVIVRALQ